MQKDHIDVIWAGCLRFIRDNISESVYNMWFVPIKPLSLERKTLSLEVPSTFFYEWLEEHYLDVIKVALQKEIGSGVRLVYAVRDNSQESAKKRKTISSGHANVSVGSKQRVGISTDQDFVNPFLVPGLKSFEFDSQLNSSYVFESFVEGECNRLALSVAMEISRNPGKTAFNPLLIYGGVGLGKTHLVNAVGLEVKKQMPDKAVLYVSAENFTQQYGDAVKRNNRNNFIHFYQSLDVLIIDDIQFFSGKTGTQDVFFHIFNHLHQTRKQIILTSDKSPIEIKDIDRRLLSRFKWGMAAKLSPPDYATRLAILKKKLSSDGIDVSEDVLNFMAENIVENVRELGGVVVSIIAHASFEKKPIDINLAREVIGRYIPKYKQTITFEKIKQIVSDYYNLDIASIESKSRKREVVQARQIAMYLSRKHINVSLSTIGKNIGGRDHTTVLHSCKTIENYKSLDRTLKKEIERLDVLLTT